MEDGAIGALPTKQDEEFRPFIRRLPEFKFWYSATRAIVLGFVCTWFEIFDVPVFWPVLVVYWLILFCLTSKPFLFDEKNPWKETQKKSSLGGENWAKNGSHINAWLLTRYLAVRRQIQHMIKYRYVPFTMGKAKYTKNASWSAIFDHPNTQTRLEACIWAKRKKLANRQRIVFIVLFNRARYYYYYFFLKKNRRSLCAIELFEKLL